MTRQEAKKIACRVSYQLIDSIMDGDWPFEGDGLSNLSESDEILITDGLAELIQELKRRAEK